MFSNKFELLFQKNIETTIKEKIETKILTFPINQNPPFYLGFSNFTLKLGVNFKNIFSKNNYNYMEIIDIQKDYYKIKLDNIITYEYFKTNILINSKKYNLYTKNNNFKDLFFSGNENFSDIINNDNPCIHLTDQGERLYINKINNPEKCNLNGVDEVMKIIEYVGIFCKFKKMKIYDASHIDCGNNILSLPVYRLLCKKEPSIYYKYGFRYNEPFLGNKEMDIISKFNFGDFLNNIEMILILIRETTNNILIKKNNILIDNDQFLNNSKIVEFLNANIPKDLFEKNRLDEKECLQVIEVLNFIDKFGKYNITLNDKTVDSFSQKLRIVLLKFEETKDLQQEKIL
jgi:hypothetical protein